jgi:hypothetical protein
MDIKSLFENRVAFLIVRFSPNTIFFSINNYSSIPIVNRDKNILSLCIRLKK